jgi:hypothetical protein
MNQLTQLRQLIKESIQEYIREVETSGNVAAQEAKIRACDEAITLREKKINLEGLDEAYQDMIDEAKKKNLEKEIKELQKYKKKAEKILEKMKSKSAPKKMEDESVEEEAVIDEVSLDEMSPELEEDATLDEAKKKKAAKKDKEEKEEKEVVNESFLKMQKLAGLITESEFQKKKLTNEIAKKAKNLKEETLALFEDESEEDIKLFKALESAGIPVSMEYDEIQDATLPTVKKGNTTIQSGYDINGYVITGNMSDEEIDIIYGGKWMDQQLSLKEVVKGIITWYNS